MMVSASLLTACSSSKGGRTNHAPIEDRATSKAHPSIGPVAAAQSPSGTKLPAGIENEGKLGYYTVKPGDTLIRVGLDHGQNWRDIARWNRLDRPSQIEVGQVLRISPPVAPTVATPVPVPGAASTTEVLASAKNPADGATKAAADDLNWEWPTAGGSVLAKFDESKNKGLDLGGKLGDPVYAAADGRIVYAGSGLRGYGNLVIIKHNETFLSAYAHNYALQVREDQWVTKGQKIANMGQSDSDQVKLHFEIRKQGKPVDPALYLPKR